MGYFASCCMGVQIVINYIATTVFTDDVLGSGASSCSDPHGKLVAI